MSRKDFEHSIERKVDVVLPFDPKAATQAAKLGQPLAKATKSPKLSQPLTQLLALTLEQARGEEADAPAGGGFAARQARQLQVARRQEAQGVGPGRLTARRPHETRRDDMPGFTMFLMLAGLAGDAGHGHGRVRRARRRARRTAKRLEAIRERHSRSTEVAAQAQLSRIFAQRQNAMEGLAQQLIPNPALLRKRLEQTGRSWTLGQYAAASLGLGAIVFAALIFKGLPLLLAISLALLVGARPAAFRRSAR